MHKRKELQSIPIHFFYEGVDVLPDIELMRPWVDEVIRDHNRQTANINYIFCDDAYLYEMNKRYLSHDTYTDVLSFDYSDDSRIILGDIYISVERIIENAMVYDTTFWRELARVMIHGILHFLGYDDHKPEDKVRMRKLEDEKLDMKGVAYLLAKKEDLG